MTHIKLEWLMERYQQVTQERDALRAENKRRRAQIDYLVSQCERLARASVDAQGWARTWKQAAKEKHAELDAIHRSDLGALRAENERLRIFMDAMQGVNDALLAAGEDHDDFEAMVARIILDRDALRQRVDLLRDTLGLTSSLLRVVMDATYQSDDGWNPHPDVDNRTWSPDAHVGLTFTVQELRQMKGALARARALLSDAAPTE